MSRAAETVLLIINKLASQKGHNAGQKCPACPVLLKWGREGSPLCFHIKTRGCGFRGAKDMAILVRSSGRMSWGAENIFNVGVTLIR